MKPFYWYKPIIMKEKDTKPVVSNGAKPKNRSCKSACGLMKSSVMAAVIVVLAAVVNLVLAYDSTASENVDEERKLFNYGSQFDEYNCIGERWNHQTPMYAGEYMCSYKNSYVWGMNDKGQLIWKNLENGDKYVYFKNSDKKDGVYFWLSIDGKLKIKDKSGNTIWQKKLKHYSHSKIGYRKCLSDWPCPYLHLHGDGVNVLNAYVRGEWDELNIDNHYNV